MTTSANFAKLLSFIVANVHDPSPRSVQDQVYHMQCHSCMSPYLEDQFIFISHLYRRPLAFTEKCDQNNFDGNYMRTKNCSDLCVTLRMNDKVGGRRRYGYMRGCIADILHYNRSIIRDIPQCYLVRLKELFLSPERHGFESSDNAFVILCQYNNPCMFAPFFP
uniref:Uncharacterized protein n=1 Tax=Acrobeloides nanus TaxID=290746 RepID=A0A914CN04_9BILA